MPCCCCRYFPSIKRSLCCSDPFAYSFVADHNIEHLLKKLSNPTKGDCFAQVCVYLNCKTHYVTKDSPMGQVACPEKAVSALPASVSLDALLVLSISIPMLCFAPLAPRHKRTFFIAKATQICLYHLIFLRRIAQLQRFLAILRFSLRKRRFYVFPLKLT